MPLCARIRLGSESSARPVVPVAARSPGRCPADRVEDAGPPRPGAGVLRIALGAEPRAAARGAPARAGGGRARRRDRAGSAPARAIAARLRDGPADGLDVAHWPAVWLPASPCGDDRRPASAAGRRPWRGRGRRSLGCGRDSVGWPGRLGCPVPTPGSPGCRGNEPRPRRPAASAFGPGPRRILAGGARGPRADPRRGPRAGRLPGRLKRPRGHPASISLRRAGSIGPPVCSGGVPPRTGGARTTQRPTMIVVTACRMTSLSSWFLRGLRPRPGTDSRVKNQVSGIVVLRESGMSNPSETCTAQEACVGSLEASPGPAGHVGETIMPRLRSHVPSRDPRPPIPRCDESRLVVPAIRGRRSEGSMLGNDRPVNRNSARRGSRGADSASGRRRRPQRFRRFRGL